MTYSLFGGPLALAGLALEHEILPSYKYFFSDKFGEAKRLEYLNYIRVENNNSGCKYKVWEFFIKHPVAAHRLLVTADVASRALMTFGCALTVTAAAGTLGLPVAGIIGLNCLVITPLVTKVLQFKWEELRCLDKVLQSIVLLAGGVSQTALFVILPEFDVITCFSLGSWLAANVSGFSNSRPADNEERYWNEVLYFKRKNLELIRNGETYTVLKIAQELDAMLPRILANGNCDESRQVRVKYLRLFVTRTVAEFHTKFTELHNKISDCPYDLERLKEILDELHSLADLEKQLEPLHSRMLDLMPLENDFKKSLEGVKKHFKTEWDLLGMDLQNLKTIYEEKIIKAFFPIITHKMTEYGLSGNKENFELFHDLCSRMQNPFELNSSSVKFYPPSFDLKKLEGKFYSEEKADIPETDRVDGKEAGVPVHQDAPTTCCLIMLYTCICCLLME